MDLADSGMQRRQENHLPRYKELNSDAKSSQARCYASRKLQRSRLAHRKSISVLHEGSVHEAACAKSLPGKRGVHAFSGSQLVKAPTFYLDAAHRGIAARLPGNASLSVVFEI